MSRDTDRDWEKIAAENPYWGVLSSEDFRGEEISSELRTKFFASGERLIINLIEFVRKHLDHEFDIGRSLDFGCGVGRLLIPMAKHSKEAVGVDVAESMLELTKKNLIRAGILNASVVLGDDTLSRIVGKFNFINSYIVLQHVPPERGMALIGKLLSLLEIGGVGSLQLTYGKHRRFFIHESPKAQFFRRDGNLITDLLPDPHGPPEGTVTMYDYDLNQIFLQVSQVAGHPILVLPTNDDDHVGLHLIFKKSRDT
jgi:SAM-dependent methyltransferase